MDEKKWWIVSDGERSQLAFCEADAKFVQANVLPDAEVTEVAPVSQTRRTTLKEVLEWVEAAAKRYPDGVSAHTALATLADTIQSKLKSKMGQG